MSAPRPVVLVHGAFHGAWCWAALGAELDRRGVPSLAIDLPGHGASTAAPTDLHGDADALAGLLDQLDDEAVVVGHSYGGAVISQTSAIERIAHLVYLTALVPEVGSSAADVLGDLPASGADLRGLFVREDGFVSANPEVAPRAFYNTCDAAAIEAALPRLCGQRSDTMTQPTSRANWQTRPSTFVRCNEDNAISAAAQDILAQRCDSVLEIDTDHSPFVCAPADLAELLVPLARR
jgi:pimeloyl-ACP methyl ester carboxylesterase